MKRLIKNKKITTIFITILFFNVFFIGQTFAQTTSVEELTTKINELLKTVTLLQEKLTNIQQNSIQNNTNGNFSRNLSLGDKGEDVKQLQILLNSDFRTKIASTGIGSSGNETTYFGNLTKQAVIKFQELFSYEVLIPINLTQGTGFVGNSTRSKLNALQDTQIEIQNLFISENMNEENLVFEEYDELILSFPSQYEGLVGTKISIGGVGFTKENNTIYFDNIEISNISSPTGTSVEVVVPNLPIGKHVVYASNSKGTSSKDLFFIVTPNNSQKPVVISSSPKIGPSGTEITIKGSNFTENKNEIRTTFDIIKNIKSVDGKTLVFKMTPFSNIMEIKPGINFKKGLEFPIVFYVINENGISEEFGEFMLKI